MNRTTTTAYASSGALGPMRRSALVSFWVAALVAGCGFGSAPRAAKSSRVPQGVLEIVIPSPIEVSGVAAYPGGVVVVGDEQSKHARLWPGGDTWPFRVPMPDCESIDIGFAPLGAPLVLAVSEDDHAVRDLFKGEVVLDKSEFGEQKGRGLEGVAIRSAGTSKWDVAVLWEGGYGKGNKHKNPRVALFLPWTRGITNTPTKVIELEVPIPSKDQRFRAPDLVWKGKHLLVLLGATSKNGKAPYNHTWLQEFDLNGKPVETPLKLEDMPRDKAAWKTYRQGRNWEGLDWSLDGTRLLMGYDTLGPSFVCSFPYPYE